MMRRWFAWQPAVLTLCLMFVLVVAFAYWPIPISLEAQKNLGENYDVRILRDAWGVPHIFGKTDGDAAFGLAYAHAEDDFLTIQQTLVAARGDLAQVYGFDAAPNDYLVGMLRIHELVDLRYAELMPDTQAVLQGYADGLNYYAALHEEAVLLETLFPISGMDIAAASVHKNPLFFGLDKVLSALFEENHQPPKAENPTSGDSSKMGYFFPENLKDQAISTHYGSNTFAVAPSKTANHETYLAINSHQPWTGPVAWYEANVHSEEGWDMVGGLFPGTPVIIHGHNKYLGWGFTVNHPDLVDVYVLKENPKNHDQYWFDGQWMDFEKGQIPIEVLIFGKNLKIKTTQEALWSTYGPVIRRDHGTYAFRFPGFDRVDIFQQLYQMNKAKNFDEWITAFKKGGLPMFNVGYADRDGNIYYLYNGLLPVRNENYDWSLYLPGDTSQTLWKEYLPFEKLPQVLNPPSGFIQNANSTPFQTTNGDGNPNPHEYSPTLGIETKMTNRSLRMIELLGSDSEITYDEFIAYKFDMSYAPQSDVAYIRDVILNSRWDADSDIQTALQLLDDWDLKMSPDSKAASLAAMIIWELLQMENNLDASEMTTGDIPDDQIQAAFLRGIARLRGNFGRVDVPWGQVNRLRRGEQDLPLGGGPDTLRAVYGSFSEDGRLVANNGDGYILLAAWDAKGDVRSLSIHQFGSSTLDETSPHYADQAGLFAKMQLKPVWMEESEIRKHLFREYRPGEEQQGSP